MDYKLIAVDIDGTLTNSRKEITPRTRHALLEAQAKGKRVIIASGRQPLGVYPIAQDLMLERYKGYIMSYNGGKIISCETNRTIINRLFPREYLSDIVGVLKDSNITVITWDDRRIYADSKRNDYTDVEQDVLKTEMVVVLKHNLYRICERTNGHLLPVCIIPAEQSPEISALFGESES